MTKEKHAKCYPLNSLETVQIINTDLPAAISISMRLHQNNDAFVQRTIYLKIHSKFFDISFYHCAMLRLIWSRDCIKFPLNTFGLKFESAVFI